MLTKQVYINEGRSPTRIPYNVYGKSWHDLHGWYILVKLSSKSATRAYVGRPTTFFDRAKRNPNTPKVSMSLRNVQEMSWKIMQDYIDIGQTIGPMPMTHSKS